MCFVFVTYLVIFNSFIYLLWTHLFEQFTYVFWWVFISYLNSVMLIFFAFNFFRKVFFIFISTRIFPRDMIYLRSNHTWISSSSISKLTRTADIMNMRNFSVYHFVLWYFFFSDMSNVWRGGENADKRTDIVYRVMYALMRINTDWEKTNSRYHKDKLYL